MSLISARNFVAPLQNKVHLGTIILVAVCFAFLRGAGASFGTYNKNYAPERRSRTIKTQQLPGKKRFSKRAKSDIQLRPKQNQRPTVQRKAKSQPESSSLFDLEKELGLK